MRDHHFPYNRQSYPADDTYETTEPIPDGTEQHPHQWEHLPPNPVPLRVKLYATLLVALVLAAAAIGILRSDW